LSEKDISVNESAQTTSEKSHNMNENVGKSTEFFTPNRWPTHTTVGNMNLPFPHFNIGPTFITRQRRYSASDTCSLDSSLFLLYYIYMSHSQEFRSLFDPTIAACKQLLKTFDLVEKKGWDVARLYWVTVHSNYLKDKRRAHINLHATADTNVFQYVREVQKYVTKSTCTCTDCPKLVAQSHSVDISLP
jgi:hypothetical protein